MTLLECHLQPRVQLEYNFNQVEEERNKNKMILVQNDATKSTRISRKRMRVDFSPDRFE